MKKLQTRKLLVSALALVFAFALVAFVPTTTADAAKNAMGYELGFKTVATLDFTKSSTIVNPKDITRTATVGELRYFDYEGDLLSIVDDANATGGKAVLVASATDFPRTSFNVQSDVLYKFSYKVKMTDETKWKDSFGISPYINTYAKNETGVNGDKGGKDFHRDYADVVYGFTTEYKTTEIYFSTSYKTNSAGDKFVTINYFDTFENALAKNERDSFTHAAGYTDFCNIDFAFYMQGGSKTMSYELSNVELAAYSVIYGEGENETVVPYDYNAEETLTKEVYAFEVKEENVVVDATATDSSSNPGKLVVNGKDGYLSIVDDADAKGGKAVQVKDAYEFPRLRVNTLVAGKPYKVSYKIKMVGEENWTDGNLGITPYLNFTTYNPTAANWQPDNGWDFHCGYKYVQNAFNGKYQTVEFYFDTVVENDVLTLNIYGDTIAYTLGIPTETFTFNAGYVELAAFDIAFYTQGSNKGMAYNLADITITTEEDPVVEPPIDEPTDSTDSDSTTEQPGSDEPTSEPTSTPEESEDNGCGGVIDGGFAALAICGLAVVAMKSKKN